MARTDRMFEGGGSPSGIGRAIAGKASGAKMKLTSTGKAKVNEYNTSSTKKYEAPVKGSGKPKYQNAIKEIRVDTKAPGKEAAKGAAGVLKNTKFGKPSKQEITRKEGKKPNIAKQIDRETKVQKGVRTEKPLTPKVPVKKSGKK